MRQLLRRGQRRQLGICRANPGRKPGEQLMGGGGLPVQLQAVPVVREQPGGQQLDGQAATTHQLLAGFPARIRAADAELAALAAAEELAHGSLEAAERYLGLAERGMASVPDARRAQAHLLLGINRLVLARQRWNLQAVAEEARQLQAMAEAPDPAPVS